MIVELRKFRSYPRLSEETTAFNAHLYIDGKKMGEASNRGHGEPISVYWDNHEMEKQFGEYLKTLPMHSSLNDMTEDLFLGLLVDKHGLCEQLKKWAKGGKTVARLKTDKPGEWFVTKQTPPEVRRRFTDKLECIANDDFEKAAGIEVFNG